MKSFFQGAKVFVLKHKKTSIVVCIIVIICGYYLYKNLTSTAGDTTYVLGAVERSTIVSSITGSGQVASGRTLDLKPKATGDVVYIGAVEGTTVSAGTIIVELDPTAARKAVRDAQANLDGAKISLQKLQLPADSLSLLQAKDALTQAKADLASAYADGYTNVSSALYHSSWHGRERRYQRTRKYLLLW